MTELHAATSICPDSQVSFELEILPHLDSLGRLALRLTHNQADAHDLVQETVLRAWRFFHHFRAGSNSRAWLYAILQNNFRNHWRKRELERSVVQLREYLTIDSGEPEILAHEPGPEREVAEHLTGEAIAAALRSLPETFRSALVLVDAQELAYDAAAAALRVPIGTVKSRVSRGRAMMRHALKERARLEGLAATRPQQRYTRSASTH